MTRKEEILKLVRDKKQIKTSEIASLFKVSRQFIHSILSELVREQQIVKVGSTRSAFYVPIGYAQTISRKVKLRLQNKELKEHEILESINDRLSTLSNLKENVRGIFDYAFLEMLNNAIEHSRSQNIEIEIPEEKDDIKFIVNDFGVGVFRDVMEKKKLKSELEAIQDLLKGKTTSQPKLHSGEGIFFTSRAADLFILESFGYKLRVDNKIKDIFIEELRPQKIGTKVIFSISKNSSKHLNYIFKKYQSNRGEFAFDKTEVKVRLYTLGTIYISRSQARRVMVGLEKFKSIILDFDKVPTIGQAFADEVFRVFPSQHPDISIKAINMNEAVRFMINRVGKPSK
jgi:anti-sigma regulatory factor (Ser/Thr protein kinase)